MANKHSLFSFTGTKYRLLDFLKANIKIDNSSCQWFEPFCGSCVVGLNFQPKCAYFNDINSHLIAFYKIVKWCKMTGFDFRRYFEENYVTKLKESHSQFYYQVRNEFNKKWKELGMTSKWLNFVNDNSPEQWEVKFAMDFFFLCQSSFSHQLRYNRRGEINMAYSKFEYLLDTTTIDGLYNRLDDFANFVDNDLSHVEFSCKDWEEFLPTIKNPDNSFVYCDPPYVGTIQDYISKGFSEFDLKMMVKKLEELGVDFAISGSCSEEDKEKTQDLFTGHKIVFKEHKYNMNSKGQKIVNEYLVLR